MLPSLFAELGPISKTQNTQARERACEEILPQACRHAPTLLDYEPSYKGVLKKKDKKKDGEPSDLIKGKKSGQPSQGTKKKRVPTDTEGPSQKRQKGVRLPKIGFSAEEWLSLLGQDIREPTEAEMSRRNIPRPSIPTKSANPARGRGADQQQQQQKKQKLSDEVPPPSASKTAPSETRRPPPQKDQGRQTESPVDLDSGPVEAEVPRSFSPSYTMVDGRVLMLKDSVKEEPNLAVTLLRGLALPRDCDQLPTELIPGLGDMCSHLVQVYLHPLS
ncbi:hypothetical protein RHGRI_031382 [Rhododendron griersonianum]|uniref:Uncharacterized protein n=1 Tax=Rhododendron griersonianum TaxID=479676 RepID=A0AAV6ICB6_9ERIC|nr:hypothetical protein RHGRI_031382 [Rhododendron griersonianum]